MNDTREYIHVINDDGIEETLEAIFKFEINDKKYIFLSPIEEESVDVYAFSYEEQGDSAILHKIEDGEEWNKVEEVFNKLKEESVESGE